MLFSKNAAPSSAAARGKAASRSGHTRQATISGFYHGPRDSKSKSVVQDYVGRRSVIEIAFGEAGTTTTFGLQPILEQILQPELYDASIRCRSNTAVLIGGIRIGSWRAEVRTVQRIKQFRPELQLVRLADSAEALLYTRGHIDHARCFQLTFGTRCTSELARLVGHESCCIEVSNDPLRPRTFRVEARIFDPVRPVWLPA